MTSRAYGEYLRALVLATGLRAAAVRFNVGVATAILWLRQERETGERTARRQGKPRGSRFDAHEAFIVGMIEARRNITRVAMAAHLREDRAVENRTQHVGRWLRQRGWCSSTRPARRRR